MIFVLWVFDFSLCSWVFFFFLKNLYVLWVDFCWVWVLISVGSGF